ncbi:uncharacterized protein LY89DRAFT_763817 [Mollisia scopiformis]|uniref:Uncharacterized protein n=1 Tax=Mollisia scopiformis TaxID=149040 RepID=A0A132B9S8_MOLSC|nr:uncharacterized protein LY89DRAFT_763817 [Mollisia scopiformis]KUJ09162.1 hypothetical protein LY89DRAFT_763817 [Mollisia scopiformis]
MAPYLNVGGLNSTFAILQDVPPPSGTIRVLSRTRKTYNKKLIQSQVVPAVRQFITQHSKADLSAITGTLTAFFDSALKDYGARNAGEMAKAQAWVFITISKINSYGKHYWHRDGICGLENGRVLSRYSMAMVGPPTEVICSSEPQLGLELHHAQKGLESLPRHPIATGQVYRFTTGQGDSPIHSTPVFKTGRIFVSVIYY